MGQVKSAVEVVRDIVLVEWHVGQTSSQMAQLVHDEVCDRLDQLIDMGVFMCRRGGL